MRTKVVEYDYKQIYREAKKRSKKKRIEFTITLEQVLRKAEKADGRCRLTGMEFNLRRVNGATRRPYAPSLDRINSAIGYTNSNVRIVCVCVNIALNEWGDKVFKTMAESYIKTTT